MRKITGIQGLSLIAAIMIGAGMAHAEDQMATETSHVEDYMDSEMIHTYPENHKGSKLVYIEEPNVEYAVDYRHEAVFFHGQADLDLAGLGEHEARGFGLLARGIYDNGLRFDLSAASLTSDTIVDQNAVALTLRYVPGYFGMVARYNRVHLNGLGTEDFYGLGVATQYFARQFEVDAILTTDVNSDFDDFILELNGRYDLTDRMTVIGEFVDGKVNNENVAASLGMSVRYGLNENIFLQGGAESTIGSANVESRVYSAGIGFLF